MDGRQLKEIIAEALSQQNFSVKKLVETTNIPENYIKLFLDGQLHKLPPAPYVRGYLTKIAQVLGLDKDELWQVYKNEVKTYSSGPLDRLPSNRFVIKSGGKKILFFGVLGLMVVSYLIWNANQLIGVPYLQINNPSENTTIVSYPVFMIDGKTDVSNKLTINNEQIYIDKDGQFKKKYDLQSGLNNFEIVAKKFLGREMKIIKKIIYEEPIKVEEVSSTRSN